MRKKTVYLSNRTDSSRWLAARKSKSSRGKYLYSIDSADLPEHLRRLRVDERLEVVLTGHKKPRRRWPMKKKQFGFIIDRDYGSSTYLCRTITNFARGGPSFCGADFERQVRLDPLGNEEYILAVVRRIRV